MYVTVITKSDRQYVWSSHRMLERAIQRIRRTVGLVVMWECPHCYAVQDIPAYHCATCNHPSPIPNQSKLVN